MPADRNAELALVLADPQRIATLQADDVPSLLGALEQLRASLWVQMVRVPVPAAREPGTDASDEILTVADVSDELRFTRSYVYEAIRRGDLAAVRKGKYVRVRRSDLRAWLDGHSPRSLDARPALPDSDRHAPTRHDRMSLSSPSARVSRRMHKSTPARADAGGTPDR